MFGFCICILLGPFWVDWTLGNLLSFPWQAQWFVTAAIQVAKRLTAVSWACSCLARASAAAAEDAMTRMQSWLCVHEIFASLTSCTSCINQTAVSTLCTRLVPDPANSGRQCTADSRIMRGWPPAQRGWGLQVAPGQPFQPSAAPAPG